MFFYDKILPSRETSKINCNKFDLAEELEAFTFLFTFTDCICFDEDSNIHYLTVYINNIVNFIS